MATTIPPITETIEPYSVTPVINTSSFPEDIDTYNQEQPSRITSKNTVNTQVNATVAAMNTVSNEVEANALSAESDAQIAASVVDSKGAWSNLTGALNIPASVTHTDSVWVLNVNLADVTASEPTDVNTDWTEVSGVTQSELDLKADQTAVDLKRDISDSYDRATLDQRMVSIPASNLLVGNTVLTNTVNTLVQNQVTLAGNSTTDTHITTDIESYEAKYSASRTYDTTGSNNFKYAVDRDTSASDIKLYEYINVTPSSGQSLTDTDYFIEVSDDVAVDFFSSKIEIKALNLISTSHQVTDTIRGLDKYIYSDSTAIEGTHTDKVLNVTTTGVTLGTNSYVNQSGTNYVLSQCQYNKLVITTNNHGKRVLVAYDAVSNRGMALHVGSGLDDYELKTYVGDEVQLGHTKSLAGSVEWRSGGKVLGDGYYASLNNTAAKLLNTIYYKSSDVNKVVFGSSTIVNLVDQQHITYFEGNSDVTKIFPYIGDGTVGQKFLTDGREPSRFVAKSVSATSGWHSFDNVRTNDGYILYLNDSVIEDTGTDYIDLKLDGIEVVTTKLGINGLGREQIGIAYFNSKNTTGGGSFSDLPSDTTNVELTDGQMIFAASFTDGHAKNTSELFAGANNIIPIWIPSKENYIFRNKDTSWDVTDNEPIFGTPTTRNKAGYNPDVFLNGKWYPSSNGDEKVVNGKNLINTDDWVAGELNDSTAAVLSVVGEKLRITNSGATYGAASQAITVEVGKTYTFKEECLIGTATADRTRVGNSVNNDDYGVFVETASGIRELSFVATQTTIYITLANSNDADTYNDFENITLFETNIELDTAYTTPRTYLNKSVEIDVNGDPVELNDFAVPDISVGHVKGDVVESDNFKGKNACTGVLLLDGTTTPPTWDGSYGILDVIRTSTGVFDVFPDSMVDAKYTTVLNLLSQSYGLGSIQELTKTKDKFTITMLTNAGSAIDGYASVNLFGGKD